MILLRRLWLIVPIGAVLTLLWIDGIHFRRAEYVSGLPEWSAEAPRTDPTSPTGYAEGRRRLIVPGHNNASYQWIAQTQQMFARGEWRVRRVDYENVPAGREVNSASPYRWWLGLVAWLDHVLSGRSPGLAVEHAALFADPLLHLLFLGTTTAFVAWQFGGSSAALLSVALMGVFPFGASFFPGALGPQGLMQAEAVWSILLLLAGVGALHNSTADREAARQQSRRWFFAAGVMGGFGLWINVPTQLPLLIGVAMSGLVVAVMTRRNPAADPVASVITAPWRSWAIGGALASAGGYLVEYFPGRVGFPRLEVIHPLFALAWLGGGELLARVSDWIQRGRTTTRTRNFGAICLAVIALAALPVALVRGHISEQSAANGGMPATLNARTVLTYLTPGDNPFPTRLTAGAEIVADSVGAWVTRDGFSAAAVATFLPLLLIPAALFVIVGRATGPTQRTALTLALGPSLTALLIACLQLRWWSTLDCALLTLLIAGTASFGVIQPLRWSAGLWSGLVALIVIPGGRQLALVSTEQLNDEKTLTRTEVEGYIERDLAHWLADRAGPEGATVLASPNLTSTLYFHGGLRGISTLNWENRDGLFAVARMVNATSPEEAQTLLSGRGVNYIVLPTWDTSLDAYTQLGADTANGAKRLNVPFIVALKQWDLPLWIRPVAYSLPDPEEFTDSVTIFQVVDEQDNPTAASRLAEYFIATKRLNLAIALTEPLRGFPRNVGALVALAQIEIARHEAGAVNHLLATLLPLLSRGADRALPWDRRVALAIVLAQGKQMDLSREQVKRCISEMTDSKLRALNSSSLFQLRQLYTHFEIGIENQKLRELIQILSAPDAPSRH